MKPKASKKRKERAAEKVAQTEKVVAKAHAERAKKTKLVEVNSPRAEGLANQFEGTAISLHSSDFRPIGSPQYTPASPPRKPPDDPEKVSLALAKPLSELDSHGLDTRWTNAVDYLFIPPNQDYINTTSEGRETNDLLRCWVEVSPNRFPQLVIFCFFLLSSFIRPFCFSVFGSVSQCGQESGSSGRGGRGSGGEGQEALQGGP